MMVINGVKNQFFFNFNSKKKIDCTRAIHYDSRVSLGSDANVRTRVFRV